jgi:hypothetical protein
MCAVVLCGVVLKHTNTHRRRVEKNHDLDVLAWWKAKGCQKDGLPILSKMARQFLGRPASSAGVERMFSKAGKFYGEDKQRQEDETLEHCLFASANTE